MTCWAKWVRQFDDGQTYVHDEPWNGRPSVANDELIVKVNENFVKKDISQHICFVMNFQNFTFWVPLQRFKLSIWNDTVQHWEHFTPSLFNLKQNKAEY